MSEKWFKDDNATTLSFLKEREEFHDALISTVWVIESYPPNTGPDIAEFSIGTGFCIDPRGFILTCAHTIDTGGITYVSNLKSSEDVFPTTVIGKSDSLDIALLKVTSNQYKNSDYVKFANDDDVIYCGEEIHSFGNPDVLNGSFMTGRVAYPFEGYNKKKLDLDIGGVRRSYNHKARLDDRILFHRTIGTIASEDMEAYTSLNPDIPIFQISHFYAVEGASGSPVFDNKGYVIGMVFLLHERFNLAIHFRALKSFIQGFDLDKGTIMPKTQQEKDPEPGKKQPKKKRKNQDDVVHPSRKIKDKGCNQPRKKMEPKGIVE